MRVGNQKTTINNKVREIPETCVLNPVKDLLFYQGSVNRICSLALSLLLMVVFLLITFISILFNSKEIV